MKKLLLLAIVAMGLHACTEKNTPETTRGEQDGSSSNSNEISCDTYLIEYDVSETISKTILLTARGAWSATKSVDWISIDPPNGIGNAFVQLSAEAGPQEDGYVIFSTEKASAKVTIKRIDKWSKSFSVSKNKKVYFSKGNLQYRASTNSWRFAESPTDIVGVSNKNISASYKGWIDLFGWGTGGDPTNASANASDYSTFSDWGMNDISNDNNSENHWRTLTKDEWVYLHKNRTNAKNLFGKATVSGICGYMFLPDGWRTPSSLSFQSSPGDFTTNQYTSSQWSIMRDSGAVFLPAAGWRYNSQVCQVNECGIYWSSTPDNSDSKCAWELNLDKNTMWSVDRSCGNSVRLVQDVK